MLILKIYKWESHSNVDGDVIQEPAPRKVEIKLKVLKVKVKFKLKLNLKNLKYNTLKKNIIEKSVFVIITVSRGNLYN